MMPSTSGPKKPSPSASALTVISFALALSGCADPGSTTCDEYAALTSSEAADLERDLLRANDLEPSDLDNNIGIRQNIVAFCGLPGAGLDSAATTNSSSPIEEAVDWDSGTWG